MPRGSNTTITKQYSMEGGVAMGSSVTLRHVDWAGSRRHEATLRAHMGFLCRLQVIDRALSDAAECQADIISHKVPRCYLNLTHIPYRPRLYIG